MTGPSWRDQAACAGVDPRLMDGGEYLRGEAAVSAWQAAKAVCAGCPVAQQCLAEALRREKGESFASRATVRGGLTPSERIRLQHPGKPQPAQCGTESGYRKHTRTRQDPCEPCRAAHREGNRNRDQRRSALRRAAA